MLSIHLSSSLSLLAISPVCLRHVVMHRPLSSYATHFDFVSSAQMLARNMELKWSTVQFIISERLCMYLYQTRTNLLLLFILCSPTGVSERRNPLGRGYLHGVAPATQDEVCRCTETMRTRPSRVTRCIKVSERVTIGAIQNCHNFHERTQCMLGGRGSRATVCFLKMSFMVHCYFEEGSRNQHFQSTIFVGREFTQKSSLCMLLKTHSLTPISNRQYVFPSPLSAVGAL